MRNVTGIHRSVGMKCPISHPPTMPTAPPMAAPATRLRAACGRLQTLCPVEAEHPPRLGAGRNTVTATAPMPAPATAPMMASRTSCVCLPAPTASANRPVRANPRGVLMLSITTYSDSGLTEATVASYRSLKGVSSVKRTRSPRTIVGYERTACAWSVQVNVRIENDANEAWASARYISLGWDCVKRRRLILPPRCSARKVSMRYAPMR